MRGKITSMRTQRDKRAVSSAVECFEGRRQGREAVLVCCVATCHSTAEMMAGASCSLTLVWTYWMVCMTLYFSGEQKARFF